MMAEWGTILTEVTTYLNTLVTATSFTATRDYLPKNALTALDTIKVVVFPRSEERLLINRGTYKTTYEATVAITQKTDPTESANGLDSLLVLSNEIATALQDKEYTSTTTTAVQNSPVYDYDKYATTAIFQALVNVTLDGYSDA